jgi:hypothetical protein
MALLDSLTGDKPVKVEVALEQKTVLIIGTLIVVILVCTFYLVRSAKKAQS